jgi:hypothetical protein
MATKTSKRAEAKVSEPAPVSRRLAWLTEAADAAAKTAEAARAEAAAAVVDPSFGLDGWRSDTLSRLVEANAANKAWKQFFEFWDGGCGLDGTPTTAERIDAAQAWVDDQITDAARDVLPNSTSGAHNLMRAHETHARLDVLTSRYGRSVKAILTYARQFLRDGSCYDDLAAAEVTAIHQEQDRYRDG